MGRLDAPRHAEKYVVDQFRKVLTTRTLITLHLFGHCDDLRNGEVIRTRACENFVLNYVAIITVSLHKVTNYSKSISLSSTIPIAKMDREQRIAQHDAIKTQLQTLTNAVNAYSTTFEKNSSSDDLAAIGKISECQVTMAESVKQMQSAIYGPLNMVMLHYEEVSFFPSCCEATVRAGPDLGLWK